MDLLTIVITILLSLLSFIGMSLIHSISNLTKKLDLFQNEIQNLKIDIEVLKNKI